MLNNHPPWLRIVHVNEGAQLNIHQLAALHSLILQTTHAGHAHSSHEKQPQRTLVTLGGNYLGPSLPAALDGGGACHVDQWNGIGVTHACLGLHETNHVPASILAQRLEQAHFGHVNTNCQGINHALSGVGTQAYATIEVPAGATSSNNPSSVNNAETDDTSMNGGSGNSRAARRHHKRRVALLGLLSDDANLHAIGSICANTHAVQSVLDTAQHTCQTLCSGNGRQPAQNAASEANGKSMDAVIPMTFQSAQDNRLLAQQLNASQVPVILCGGGDSVGLPYHRSQNHGKSARDDDDTSSVASSTASSPRSTKFGRKASSQAHRRDNSAHALPLQLPLHETLNGIHVVQPAAGMAAVVDITWPAVAARLGRPGSKNKWQIQVQFVPLNQTNPHLPLHPPTLERGLCFQTLWNSAGSVLSPTQRLFRADRWLRHPQLLRAWNEDNADTAAEAATNTLFSTTTSRHQTSVALSALATLMRLGWNSGNNNGGDVQNSLATVLLPAHCVTGTTASSHQWFTWRDLQREMPHPLLLTSLLLPGHVLQDMIIQSRSKPRSPSDTEPPLPPQKEAAPTPPSPPKKSGLSFRSGSGKTPPSTPPRSAASSAASTTRISFLHTCSNVHYRPYQHGSHHHNNLIQSICGEPFDLQREYWVALPVELLDFDGVAAQHVCKPLLQWTLQQQQQQSSSSSSGWLVREVAQYSHLLIAKALAPTLWFQPKACLDLRVHGKHGLLAKAQLQTVLCRRLQETTPHSSHASTAASLHAAQESVAAQMADFITHLAAAGDHYHDDNDVDHEDIITPVDIMLKDPILLDAIVLRRDDDNNENNNNDEAKKEEEALLLRDCAADFVGVDDHAQHVTELVQQFREAVWDDDSDDDEDDAEWHARLTGPSSTTANPTETTTDALHAPLVRRLTRKNVLTRSGSSKRSLGNNNNNNNSRHKSKNIH